MLRRMLGWLVGRWRRQRQAIELTVVDQAVLRTLFDIGRRGASAQEILQTARDLRPANALEVRLSVIKLLENGLAEVRRNPATNQEVYRAARRADFLRPLIPERPAVNIDVWL